MGIYILFYNALITFLWSFSSWRGTFRNRNLWIHIKPIYLYLYTLPGAPFTSPSAPGRLLPSRLALINQLIRGVKWANRLVSGISTSEDRRKERTQLNKWIYMDVFVLNIIFSCRKMVKIRVDLMIKLQQFPLLPYRWSKNQLRRNGNNYLKWNSQLRRNGNKP